ncbi:MAG TPA: pyrroline-5-carboxylate reductase [Clostridiales bacterium]|jgi:pyrroline-5-carboxylate reductase|nr:pyrroline-5-carboxylate reductase [Clostridiales bacterium]
MTFQRVTIGFIGAGNMGSAMIRCMIKRNAAKPEFIWIYDQQQDKCQQLQEELGVNIAQSSKHLAVNCSIIVLAVKPSFVAGVLSEIKNALTPSHLVLSIAAGITIRQLKDMIQEKCYVIRTMPNTPALIGEGMTAICKDSSIPEEYLTKACSILKSFGSIEFVTESQIHGATAISGSSPAYAFLFLEALADGGVMMGLSREQSYKMAAQSLLGAAKMVLQTGKHPGELKDMVCSPGGTTINAVASLEQGKFRSTIIEAVRACAKKSMDMEKGR